VSEQSTTRHAAGISRALQVGQLIVIVIGVAGIFMTLGRRDATIDQNGTQISELRAICSDLVRVVGSLSSTDATHAAQLASIDRRLDRLESR